MNFWKLLALFPKFPSRKWNEVNIFVIELFFYSKPTTQKSNFKYKLKICLKNSDYTSEIISLSRQKWMISCAMSAVCLP